MVAPIILSLGISMSFFTAPVQGFQVVGGSQSPSQALQEDQIVLATVVSATPVTRRIGVPQVQQLCSWETVPINNATDENKPARIITGAIIGSVIGNNIKGEQHGGTAGAVLGGLIANAVTTQPKRVRFQDVETCQSQTTYVFEERISGYDVTYELEGETFTTRMDHDPGRFLRFRRSVSYSLE